MDLEAVLGQVEADFGVRQIDAATAEQLATAAAERAQQLAGTDPEEDQRPEGRIYAEDLLAPPEYGPGQTCWACWGQAWWPKAGQLVCRTCHPPAHELAAGPIESGE